MSGGHFDYGQFRIDAIAGEVERLIANNNNTEMDEWGVTIGHGYPPDIIAQFKMAVLFLKASAAMVQRIDWLVCGDDGPNSFWARWQKEVGPLMAAIRKANDG